MLIINQKKAAAAGGVSTPLTLGTVLHGYNVHENSTSGGGFISVIPDLVGSDDLIQVSGGAQPATGTINSRNVAVFSPSHTMAAGGLADMDHSSGFTIMVGAAMVTRTGTPATTDAIYDFRNAGATEITRLEAGNAATFLSDYNSTGTGFSDLLGCSADLTGSGIQHFGFEFDGTGDTVTAWIMNEVRKSTGSNTGVHDASVDFTLGDNLDFQFAYLYIYQGQLSLSEHGTFTSWANSEYGGTIVPDVWGSRNTAVPTHDDVHTVGSNITGTAGTWINARNAANSLTYQWYNNGDAGNATGTGNATLVYTIAAADETDTLKLIETNTVLGTAYTADSANTTAVDSTWTPASDTSILLEYHSDDITVSSGTNIATWPATANSTTKTLSTLVGAPQLEVAATPTSKDALRNTAATRIYDDAAWTGGPYASYMITCVLADLATDADYFFYVGDGTTFHRAGRLRSRSSSTLWDGIINNVSIGSFGTADANWHVWQFVCEWDGSTYDLYAYKDGTLETSLLNQSGSDFDPGTLDMYVSIPGALVGDCEVAYLALTEAVDATTRGNYETYCDAEFITP